MTREELHEQVWSQPMSTLAKSIGISDVALAKRCKAANVPVPPRGWWARKEAGKAVKIEPLPPLPFVLANYFPARDHIAEQAGRLAAEGSDAGIPIRPAFRDLAAVSDEIRLAVKPFKVPPTLTNPHPIVARLLKQDEQRTPSRWRFDSSAQKFTRPIQQRRLRILSSILTELAKLGCKASGSTHAGERFSINVGGHWIYIFFGVEGGDESSIFYRERVYRRPDREGLRFDLVEHDDRRPPKRIWREDKIPLEQQATEIVCGLFIQLEEDAREWKLWQYKWACDDRERKIKEARIAAEKAEAERIVREEAAAAARIGALLGGADAFEQAARIRRYVAAVKSAAADSPQVSADVLERWASWALKEADTMDPTASGRFMSDLDLLPLDAIAPLKEA